MSNGRSEKHLLEQLRELRMDRRAFLSRLAAAGGLAAAGHLFGGGLSQFTSNLSGSGTASAQQRNQVIYLGWGGAWQRAMTTAYFEPFTRQTKVPVTYATPYEFARVKAMQDAGRVEVDFATAPASDFEIGLKQGYYQKLDFGLIDRTSLDESQIVGGGYGIVASAISYVLTYNTRKWPGDNHPGSWADFWDTRRFPGPRTLRDTPEATLEIALLADGVPKDRLYPLDVDRAFKKLDQIKEHVVWYNEVTQSQQLIQNQEVDLAMMVNGRASDSIINSGAPYRIEWNQQIYLGTDKWVVFKGAPNRDNAMRMVGFGGQGTPQAIFATALFYGPSNSRAFKYIDERTSLELPTHPRNLAKAVTQNLEWWTNNRDAVTRRWIAWKLR